MSNLEAVLTSNLGLVMYGLADDTWAWISILGSRTSEVCIVHDMGMYGIFFYYCLSMVFLGLFAGIQFHGYEWIYRQLG